MDWRPSRLLAISACSAPVLGLVQRQRLALEFLCLAVLTAAREHGGKIAQRLANFRIIRPAAVPPHRQDVSMQTLGLLRPAFVLPEPGELRHGFGSRFRVLASLAGGAERHRPLEEGLGAIRRRRGPGRCGPPAASCRPGRRADPRARSRSPGPAVEEIERGDVGAVGHCRIGDLEEAREKPADFPRLGRFPGRDPCLPRHPDEPGDERQQHQRRRSRANGMAPHELARAIRPTESRPRGDRQATRDIAADVLDKLPAADP